jgi:coenzyme Q-binding protein COQ10
MGSVFDKAFRKFTEAFEERADEIYGSPERSSSLPRAAT